MRYWPTVVVVFLFLLAGCTQIMQPYADAYTAELARQAQEDRALFDATLLPAYGPGECVCFTCDQTSVGILQRLGLVQRTSLVGATCEFRAQCTPQEFDRIQTDTDLAIRPFAIGQGTGFGDFAQAQAYCVNRLDMPVKWLHDATGTGYPLPTASRARCFLELELMPLYILYSGGKSADTASAEDVARILADTGPVIVTTEMDPQLDDPALLPAQRAQLLDAIAGQAIAMKAACPNCLVALGVKMGDYQGLEDLLSRQEVKDNIDLVAFGINTHYSKASCDPAASDFRQAAASLYYTDVYPFLRNIMYTYGKPSVIAYAMFDEGPNAVPVGEPNHCTWNPLQVQEAQRYFFDRAIQPIAGLGGIGFAPYAFSSESDNPLNCQSCPISSFDPQGQIITDSEQFQNWFSFCQAYKNVAEQLPTNDLIVAYSTSPGTVCELGHNNFKFFSQTPLLRGDYAPVAVRPELQDPMPVLLACDACVYDPQPDMANPDQIPPFPFFLPDAPAYSEAYCSGRGADDVTVETLQAIDRFADKRDLDPMLVRAVVWHESNFETCTASTVPMSVACNPYNLDNKDATPAANLPAGISEPFITETSCILPTPANGRKFCAYGAMQTTEYPGYIYRHIVGDNEESYPASLRQCATELGLVNDDGTPKPYEVNPFDSTHGICIGTLELQGYVNLWSNRFATDYQTIATQLGVTGAGHDAERSILATYFALHRYNGGSVRTDWLEAQASLFSQQRGLDVATCEGDLREACHVPRGARTTSCIGTADFIDYISNCRSYDSSFSNAPPGSTLGTDYGARVLAKYEVLRNNCGLSNCPAYKKIQRAVQEDSDAGIPPVPPEEEP